MTDQMLPFDGDDNDRPMYGYQGDVGYMESSRTSEMAAAAMTPEKQRTQRKWIKQLLTEEPRTSDQLAIVTGLKHQSVSARCTELKNLGEIGPTGEKRVTRAKGHGNVWQVIR